MSDRAQRVLDTLVDFDATSEYGYPFKSLHDFVMDIDSFEISQDYELLTAEEEKQVIKKFLEIAY